MTEKKGDTMDKKNKIKTRLEAITELIKSRPIEDQATLVELIKENYGIETNQAVVSRDLRSLGVTKHQVDDKMVYELKDADASREILRLAIVNIVHNEALIVITTLPGLSNFVGDFLDMHDELEILGTIAGENTVFVAPTTIKNIKEVFSEICKVLHVRKK